MAEDDSQLHEQKLMADAEQLIEAGSFDQALPLMERAGRSALEHGRHREATLALVSAARMRVMLGQVAEAQELLQVAEPAASASGSLGSCGARAASSPRRRPIRSGPRDVWQQAATTDEPVF